MTAEQAFIVVEGANATQHLQRLQASLEAQGYAVARFDFPQTDKPSGFFVHEHLRGHYGDQQQVGPYTQSLFKALDHYHTAIQISEELAEGKVVLASQYVAGNMMSQAPRISNEDERRAFFSWVDSLGYQMLHIPRPTASFMIMDANDSSVNNAVLASIPEKLQAVQGQGDTEIDAVLLAHVMPMLPKIDTSILTVRPQPSQHQYYVPNKLDEENIQKYRQGLDKIYALGDKMLQKLTDHLQDAKQATLVLQSVLPVASLDARVPRLPAKVQELTAQVVENGHSIDTPTATLVQALPRNELDLAAAMLFGGSGSSLRTLTRTVDSLPYDTKMQIFETYLNESSTREVLSNAMYAWDMLTTYGEFSELSKAISFGGLQHQTLTPRYGYDVPTIIDDAELTDDYLECFDLSLQLYSSLQQAGYEHEAQYVTLLGHKVRWTGTCNAEQLLKTEYVLSDMSAATLQNLRKLASEAHSALFEIGSV